MHLLTKAFFPRIVQTMCSTGLKTNELRKRTLTVLLNLKIFLGITLKRTNNRHESTETSEGLSFPSTLKFLKTKHRLAPNMCPYLPSRLAWL